MDLEADIQRRAEGEPARRAMRQAIGFRLRGELDPLLAEPVPSEWLALLRSAESGARSRPS